MDDNPRGRHEKSLAQKRVIAFARFKPGQIVTIGEREELVDMASYHDPSSRWEKVNVSNIHSYQKPTSEYLDRESIGPDYKTGMIVTILAMLPSVHCDIYGERPWVLLLGDDNSLGWTYQIDALEELDQE